MLDPREMADVKCPLGRLVPAGVPATAAEMTMSIRRSGSCALRSDRYQTTGARSRENHVQPVRISILRDASEAVQSLGQGSRNKRDREPAG